jgi:phage gp29-like protein
MATNNLAMEIIDPSQFWSVINFLPKPSLLMNDKGSFYATVEDMLTDAKIGSHLRIRKDIVSSFPYILNQGKSPDNVFQFVKDNLFSSLNWETDIKEFLSAIENGFSFSEVLWKQIGGYYIPDSLRNKRPEQIQFRIDYAIMNGGRRSIWTPILISENKPLIDNYKFLIYRNNPRAEDPYGTSDMVMCYWPWKFKQFGWEFWLEAAKKCGVPSIIALFEAKNDTDAKKSAQIISETLEQIENGSGVALSNVKEVIPLEMSGVLSDHKVLIETCNQEISFALTTQSLSTQEGTYGTRAQATVHDENLVRVCHGDAKALMGTLQQLIDWMVELNFGKGIPSPKGEFDLKSYATFEEIIKAVDADIPISKEKLYSRYGLPEPKNENDLFMKEKQANLISPSESIQPTTDIQATALNGAQVSSLVDLAAQVSRGELPLDSARAIASAAFPLVKSTEIDAIFKPLVGFKGTPITLADTNKKKVRKQLKIY